MSKNDRGYRSIPPVNSILAHPLVKAETSMPRTAVVEAIRQELDGLRNLVGKGLATPCDLDQIARACVQRARRLVAASPSRVVNATGVVLHTNLGRAPLPDAALLAMLSSSGYCDLEYDLITGDRGSRHGHIDQLLSQVTGAESGMAVNNNAAAVLLALSALARDKEVIVSRGELVEIGGSFRVPDIMRQSGATLVEVGTTNRTRVQDYETAIGPDTAMIMKVHTSNYRMVGFTESADPEQLAALAHSHGLLFFHDAGSGLLADLERFGLRGEPTVQSLVRLGSDVVAFSGDKLFGGPQAGLLAGKNEVISRLRRHPLSRAFRLDKMTLAALSATLRIYAYGDPFKDVPVLRMLTMSYDELLSRARRLKRALSKAAPQADISIVMDESYPGGGSYPATAIKSPVVGFAIHGISAPSLVEKMRANSPPIIARISEDRVLLDPRTLDERDMGEITAFLRSEVKPA